MIAAPLSRILERLIATLYAVAASKIVVGNVGSECVIPPSFQISACSLRCDWGCRLRHQCNWWRRRQHVLRYQPSEHLARIGPVRRPRASNRFRVMDNPLHTCAKVRLSTCVDACPVRSSSAMIERLLSPKAAARMT